MLSVEIDNAAVRDALQALQDAIGNTDPALKQIGEYLVGSTKERFRTTTAPDGTPWERNKASTLINYVDRFKTSYTKKGRISKKGRERITGKKPGTGESRQLQTQIFYQVTNGELSVGSPMIYAGTFHYGATKGQYAPRTPWGDIPARAFLGISDSDEREVLTILSEFLLSG